MDGTEVAAHRGMERLHRLSALARPYALTVLRVTVGVIMIVHGYMKLTGFQGWTEHVASLGIPLPEVMAPLAIAGELGGGIGLVVGLLTPVAAAGVLSTMLFAIFFVHLGNGLLAKNGGFEYPLTMGVVALYFVARGAGRFSLDALIFRRLRERGGSTERDGRLTGGEAPA